MVWRDYHGSFTVDVDWPARDNEDWVELSAELRGKTGISRYRLYRNEGNWVYDYCLEIESNYDSYDYKFTDGTDDTYSLGFRFKGTHSVKFNSNSPGIRKVWGNDQPDLHPIVTA